jgi:hypothetical protein
MKTLVIHPKDITTDILSEIYSNKDWTVISTNVSKKILKEQIKTHDRIVMLVHGTKDGLIGFNRLMIDSNLVYLLREKTCVCIWCNADEFVEKYNLKGFYSGMIISEYEEAVMYDINTTTEWVNQSNTDFAFAIKNSIDSEDMLKTAIELYRSKTSILGDGYSIHYFNVNRLYSRN